MLTIHGITTLITVMITIIPIIIIHTIILFPSLHHPIPTILASSHNIVIIRIGVVPLTSGPHHNYLHTLISAFLGSNDCPTYALIFAENIVVP